MTPFNMTKEAVDSFWGKMKVGGTSECWEWQGSKDAFGYGTCNITHQSGTKRAHRVAFILTFGEIPEGIWVCHKCDNPGCANPHHMFLGTPAMNNLDRDRKGRHKTLCGEEHWSQKKPHLIRRGERHWTRFKEARRVKGDEHWSRKRPEKCRRGDIHPMALLTSSQVLEVRKMVSEGVNDCAIGRKYKVNRATIRAIRVGKTWKHLS